MPVRRFRFARLAAFLFGSASLLIALHGRASQPQENCLHATYKALRPPQYPQEAVAAHLSGKVMLRVLVEADGSIGDLSVDKSSGSEVLDNAARASVSEWKFEPSRCDGKASASYALIPIEFDLPEDGYEKRQTRPELIEDDQPMEFPTLAEELAYLDAEPTLRRYALPTGWILNRPQTYETWMVFNDPKMQWNMTGAARAAVLRIRLNVTSNGYQERYTFLCERSPEWCQDLLKFELTGLEENPIPPPPPRPPS